MALVYSIYLGGRGSGSAYIPGQTSSADFPVAPGAFQTANADGFDILSRLEHDADPT